MDRWKQGYSNAYCVAVCINNFDYLSVGEKKKEEEILLVIIILYGEFIS